MGKTVSIEPIQILKKQAVSLSCNVVSYTLDGQYCMIFWVLLDNEGDQLYSGNYNVPQSVLENWGTDDMLIINSLANDNGFIIIAN
jgi:molybdopterin/thiamine biosynthesis adenylyltransferase